MELQILKQMAELRLREIGVTKEDKLFQFAVEIWCNGYLEADKDHKMKSDYANMIEDKIKNLLK